MGIENKRTIDNSTEYKQLIKRKNRRLKSISLADAKKNERKKIAKRETEVASYVTSILKKESATEKITAKRPLMNNFLETFSFIPNSVFDKRTETENMELKCHSFNEERQYMEFFKRFIYPYNIPKPLVLTAVMQKQYYFDAEGRRRETFDFEIIRLCRKWLCDIVNGKSFYKQNKDYFTKQEAHFFLNSKIKYADAKSVLNMFFEAKCKARRIPDSLVRIITRVFTFKFEQFFNNSSVKSFLDLIGRHIDYAVNENELSDICDFIMSEIANYKESAGKTTPFSCSNRTMSSVTSLANEWHAQVQRGVVAISGLQADTYRQKTHSWKKALISNFTFENDDFIWTITQLCSVNALINEGRSMKHCVASYAGRCSTGASAIFHVSGYKKQDKSHAVSNATVEVNPNECSIRQIRGKCNAAVDLTTLNIIKRWAQTNNLKMLT